jgi:hypothetical protein
MTYERKGEITARRDVHKQLALSHDHGPRSLADVRDVRGGMNMRGRLAFPAAMLCCTRMSQELLKNFTL